MRTDIPRMNIVWKFALSFYLAGVATGSPVDLLKRSPEPEPENHLSKRDIEPIREAYRGVHWDDAFAQCTTPQFNILVESTRMALDVTNYRIGDQEYDSPAWHRYFVRDWKTNPNYGWHVSLL